MRNYSNQTFKLILTKFGTKVLWRKILVKFVKGKIHFNHFEMVDIRGRPGLRVNSALDCKQLWRALPQKIFKIKIAQKEL